VGVRCRSNVIVSVLGVAFAFAVLGCGCGGEAAAGAAGSVSAAAFPAAASPRSPAGSPDSPFFGDSAVTYPTECDVPEATTPRLPFRQYRLRGSWGTWDYTDRVCLLHHDLTVYPFSTLALMDLRDGRVRAALVRPVNAGKRFVVTGARLSDRWLAWEELSQGDDLAYPAEWRLYAAPLDEGRLTIGKPALVAAGDTARVSRPLFDLQGDLLVWLGNAGPSGVLRGSIRLRDLRHGAAHCLVQTETRLGTVSLAGDQLLMSECLERSGVRVGVALVGLAGHAASLTLDLGNRYPLVHYPATRAGWLSWSLQLDAEGSTMGLFLRAPSGAMHLVAENHPSEPRFAGHYLFFDSSGPLGSTQALSQVRGVDLRTLHQFVLVSGRSEQGGEWAGGFGAPLARHTLVVHNDRCDWAQRPNRRVTNIRVYRVD
jgi:hypothetical protein